MIHHLRGRILRKRPTSVVLECGGVGYGVTITPKDAERIGAVSAESSLHIYMHVTEGAAQLYGFLDEKDLDYFSMLFSVDRVGPKTAMAIVSVLSFESLAAAVASKDIAALRRVPGVGEKTGERILFELREKVPAMSAGSRLGAPVDAQAVEALVSLGFDKRSAEKAVAAARAEGADGLESLVTGSLKRLGTAG